MTAQRESGPGKRVVGPAGISSGSRVSVKIASALLGVSVQTLRRWDRSGVLPAERDPVNRYRVYSEARLRAWLAERAEPAAPAPAVTGLAGREHALVGRGPMLEAIDAEISSGSRLVVILGPGGMGKTRLARAWTERQSSRKVSFCSAGACRNVEDLALAIGASIGATTRAATSDALASDVEREMRERSGEVLVLDEIENADEGGLVFIGRLAATGVVILATSRVRPRLSGESVIVLPPLEFPRDDDPAGARRSSAVQLFLARAQSGGTLPVIDDDALRNAAAIVRRLEGLPLALELAASRASSLGLARLRLELDASIDAVGRGAIDAPIAHRTLESAVVSSSERLSASSLHLLECGSLLPREFELEELEALVGASAGVLDDVRSLVDHSMLSARQGAASATLTFTIHAVVREVVLGRVTGERRAALEAQHAAWRARQAVSLADDRSSAGAARIARAEEGLMRAWHWAVARPRSKEVVSLATDLARALGRLVETFGPSPALIEVLDRTIAMAKEAGIDRARRAEVSFYRGLSRLAQSQLADAKVIYEETRALCAGGVNPRFEAMTSCQLAWLALREGDAAGGNRALAEAAAAMRGHGDPAPEMLIASLQGQCELQRGRLASARRRFEHARALAVRVQDGANEASACGFLGAVAFDEGAHREAVRHYDRAVAIAEAHGASLMEAIFRGYRAMTLHQLGDAQAEAEYREAIARAARTHSVRFESLFSGWRGALLAREGRIDEASRMIDAADGLEDELARTIFSLLRGHVDLARATEASRAGESDEAQRHVAAACRRLAAVPERQSALRELRNARQFLEREILASAIPTGTAELVVGWRGRWLDHQGSRVALHTRATLQRLTWELALRRIVEPGIAADPASLVGVVWPDDRPTADSAAHRLHVAISTLRRLGLREAIVSTAEGYYFAPSLSVQLSLQT